MVGLAGCYATAHPDEQVAIFTLEMMKQEIALRFKEVSHLPKEVMERIQINDSILTPEEVVSKASSFEHLGLVCVDFADLLIKGETTESTMAHIYRTFMLGAKQLSCPIVLLSQLNRGYSGGIPRPTDIRYTGLAEALAWMILMLYNPSNDFFGGEEDDTLSIVDGTAYIICWKIRGGFRMHPDDSPGAIQIPFRGSRGWKIDNSGRWFSLKKL
jgi:replicative DNA helicase